MTTPPNRPRWIDWIPALSFAVVLMTALLTGGGILNQVRDHDRRIAALELDTKTDAKTRAELLQQLDLRLARIEVKLEMMAPAPRQASRP